MEYLFPIEHVFYIYLFISFLFFFLCCACARALRYVFRCMKIGKAVAELKSNKYTKILLSHIVKMLNVFHHVFTNQRPLFIPKGQKTDIFIGSKELNTLNSFGYFGNDYFYLKIYKLLKVSFDAYKVSI